MFSADLNPVVGSEQGGVRPVLIIQNDIGNINSPTVICAAVTSQFNKAKLPTHVEIELRCGSIVLLEQIRTIDKRRLMEKVGSVDNISMKKIDQAIRISLGLPT